MGKIALGVCSSISIYKACEIIRGFQKEDFSIQVIMTKNASRLISPLLLTALSRQRVIVDPFEEEPSGEIGHVKLAGEASLLLIAPATANMIGKIASGVADDFLSTFYLAVRCPVLVAPAMNEAMYLHRQTQLNIQKLKAWGVNFIEPEEGYLACQDEGWGRLASPADIVKGGLDLIRRSHSLKGKTVLVTAGPTREFLDPVRFLSNRSSGKMGYELAAEALKRGADVILVSGPTSLLPPHGVTFKGVVTAQEMEQEVLNHFECTDIVIMAAAVSDYRFSATASQKVKKKESQRTVELVKTQDVLGNLGRKKENRVLVGFAAETENVVKNALVKLKEKSLDLVVANDVSVEGIGFESDFNQVSLIYPDGEAVHSEKRGKSEISRMILDGIEKIVGKKH
jgi:phosphopantothenoylcysteine decarboxylase/phosphopantothenate--cysteine ligase